MINIVLTLKLKLDVKSSSVIVGPIQLVKRDWEGKHLEKIERSTLGVVEDTMGHNLKDGNNL